MRIREATQADKTRLIEMSARFLLESQYGSMFDNQATPTTIATLIDNVLALGVILVAEFEDYAPPNAGESKIVGMLAVVAIPHPLTGRNFADEIAWWVEPEYRDGLLGPKMLRAMEQWATRKGANVVKMVAPNGSTVGQFLEHVGYRPVETAYIKHF